jgi:hypothetical protein
MIFYDLSTMTAEELGAQIIAYVFIASFWLMLIEYLKKIGSIMKFRFNQKND